MATLILIAVLFSSNRKTIKNSYRRWRLCHPGRSGGLRALRAGRSTSLVGVSDAVSSVIGYGQNGIEFCSVVWLATRCSKCSVAVVLSSPSASRPSSSSSLPLIAVLYYLGIMWVIKLLGGGLQKVRHLPYQSSSHCQHLRRSDRSPAGGTSLHLQEMTDSELFAVMWWSGFRCRLRAGRLRLHGCQDGIPDRRLLHGCPGWSAVRQAAGTGKPRPRATTRTPQKVSWTTKPANVIDAAAAGASAGLQLALNVGAAGLHRPHIAMINGIFSGVGGWFGYPQLSWSCCWAGCSPRWPS